MMKKAKHKHHKRTRKNKLSGIGLLCWIIAPLAIISLLILDAIGLYAFNTERLLVIGVCLLIALIPYVEEISIKSFSIKKEHDDKQ